MQSMEALGKVGVKFYGAGIAAVGVQQLFYADFRPFIMPPSEWIPGLALWAYAGSAALILAGVMMTIDKNVRKVSLIAGGIFLALFLFYHVPHLLFINPYGKHLGTWTNGLKALAFAGGAFIIASSYPKENSIKPLERLIPLGELFFSITMVAFGIAHFIYVDFVKALVPRWIPSEVFWTYFAGIALIGSGISFTFKIKLKEVALLYGLMVFLWLITLHIPRAFADPFGEKGNEVTSVFQALAFSGIGFVMAGRKLVNR